MSLECSECERDLRGPHDPSCSRFDRTGHCEGCCDEDCPGLPISPEVQAVIAAARLLDQWTTLAHTVRGWKLHQALAALDAKETT